MYQKGYGVERPSILRIHMIEAKQCTTVFKVKEDPFLEFECMEWSFEYSHATLQGTCNGLLSISQNDYPHTTSLVVIHPLRKEYYELPPLDFKHYVLFEFKKSLGLGFDTSTNTFKMVCVFSRNGSGLV